MKEVVKMPYVYLLQPAEFINTDCYKIGISSKCDLNRLKSYGRGSRYIQYFECKKYDEAEKELINILNNTKELKLFQGREYFAGDLREILKIFMKVMNKYVEMDLLNADNCIDNMNVVGLINNSMHEKEVKEDNIKIESGSYGSNRKKSVYEIVCKFDIYKCEVCEYETKVKSNFTKHIKTKKHLEIINGDGVCCFCFKKFVNKWNRNRHLEKCTL
jgi:hypothetical protein